MKKLIAAFVIALGFVVPALAQPHTAPIMTATPAGKTINDYYKQAVYDPSQTKLGSVDDVLINDQGQVTGLVIGVGGILGAGEKDVIVAFNAVRPEQKNGEWYLTLDATKDALKSAPGFAFDKTKSAWVPAK